MRHNHHGQTRPDSKISSEVRRLYDLTSGMNKVVKRRATKKRRQRDRS